ncbi:PspC domain-containing protein [Flammeovirga yaeyamensis]|uniref:PspC domain-containing protein n=1 Tax=Flammeovirga yaeyamensis TaxID=367791 RepID=A0AAX1MYB5_9BACT|nr:PspC domain-containing protein [Flammeovirga yaeyamensis]MBB3696265.1 phage shock protein PspC (stress-responsive transcriptional regulator) [Flammeovirga yaeyamensis]NMF34946.1 PspC domain-containing protein [Flammeovirga yaeyamensis]QWG00229.1 PspC domain-containing protein [Flammeovirga yaeyamensis]
MSEESKVIYDNYYAALHEHLSTFQNFNKIILELEYKLSELLIPFIQDEFDYINTEELIHCLKIIGLPEGFSVPDNNETDKEEETEETYDHKRISLSFIQSSQEKAKDFLYKLFRDVDRQQIGGVATGIAHLLKTDPIAIRIIFLIPFLLFSETKIPLIFTTTIYIIMWLFLPEKRNLERDQNIKIFFRDKENKVLGGIAAGVSNYFGINIVFVRLLFIGLAFYFNVLILLYIVFWIVTPYSRTLKDKFQSVGKAFTLDEIEDYLNQTLHQASKSQKIIGSKIEKINNKLGTINIDPILLDILKVVSFITGAFLFLSTLVSLVVGVPVLSIALKIFQLTDIFNYIPVQEQDILITGIDRNLLTTLQYSIPQTTAVIATIQFLTLQLLLILISLSLMVFKKVVKTSFYIVLTIIMSISSILLVTALNMSVHNFDNQATHKEEILIPINSQLFTLSLDKVGNIPLNEAKIKINPYNGNDLKFVFLQESWGKTREKAIKNAKAIDYVTTINSDDVILSSHFSFPRGVKYRNQKLSLNMFLPKGVPFKINEELQSYLNDQGIHQFDDGVENNLVYNTHGHLEIFDANNLPMIVKRNDLEDGKILIRQKRFKTNTDSLQLYGNINLRIIIDPNFKGSMIKYPKSTKGEILKITKDDNNLRLYPNDFNNKSALELSLVTSNLNYIKFEGDGSIEMDDLQTDSLEMILIGNIHGDFKDINTKKADIILKGASNMDISGKAVNVFLTTNGGSYFDGKNFVADNVKAKTKGMSEMSVHALNNATIFQSPLSKVYVDGDPLHFEKHTQR